MALLFRGFLGVAKKHPSPPELLVNRVQLASGAACRGFLIRGAKEDRAVCCNQALGGLCVGHLPALVPASLLFRRRQGLGLRLPGQSNSCEGHTAGSSLSGHRLTTSHPQST